MHSTAVFASEHPEARPGAGVDHLERQEERTAHLHLHAQGTVHDAGGGQYVK